MFKKCPIKRELETNKLLRIKLSKKRKKNRKIIYLNENDKLVFNKNYKIGQECFTNSTRK